MSELIKRLRERRNQVWEQAKEIADRAAEENRAFTGEEEAQWQTLNAELDALDQRIKATLDGETRAKEAEDAFNNLQGRTPDRPEDQRSSTESELRAFLLGEGARSLEIKPQGRVDFRALSKSPATAGGNTVPISFYDRLVAHLIEVSAVMQAGATILNTGSGEQLQVPKTTAHSTATITPEAATIPTSDPAFGQITLGAFKYGVLIDVSRELVSDTGVDLEGYLAMQAGRALGNAFGEHAITGDGVSKPRGLVTDATVGKAGASTVGGQFNADDLIDLFFSVIAPYRASASARWIMSDSSIAAARKLKLTDGQYIWQPGLLVDAPDTMLGRPVLTDPYVADVALGAKSVVFGDLSQYFIRLAGGVRFERSDDFRFGTDMVTFRALLRADSALVDLTGAVKIFQGAAT